GLSAPARGWIVALQARRDGIWGKVEWTPEGRKLVPGYRGISPVIRHDKQSGRIDAILRASLTNTPNLSGLVTLHSEAAQ
ncbi:phage protease, partial [Vibrio parahaemolyticus]